MMQLDQLVLFNREGETRPITLKAGALNVITGDSRTGKSSLINILRFLLGSAKPNVPFGPIQQTVAWYGLHAHVGEAVAGKPQLGKVGVHLQPLKKDNRNQPALGQTRHALSASFVHSLFYCFQGQGEIANPEILFHRQNREWMPQTIRDTLPYFLGAQGPDDLRRREELVERRRELRRLSQRLRAAEAERTAGLDRAGALLAETVDVGLLPEIPETPTLASARSELRRVLETPTAAAQAVESGSEFDRLRDRRRELTQQVRDFGEQIRSLEQFADADHDHTAELSEQHARLASIGLIPREGNPDPICALCGHPLEQDPEAFASIERALNRADRRLELARRDTPRIEAARSTLVDRQRAARDEIRDVDQALNALAARDELVQRARDALNVQSYVRGRIALYLDNSADTDDEELERLRHEVSQAEEVVARLAAALDSEALRSRTTSLLRTVSRQMTTWARELDLEHSADGALIDLDRLTIVADTPSGPAYMDAGGIGSGMNWVGYHLTAYLALQRFFIEQRRPVPSFLVLDQPSQAFFPRDRDTGGDLDELTDTDRENTRRLYALTFEVVRQLGGSLQVVALDHADFDDDWFASSVVQRWRGGNALIPREWLRGQN